MHGPTLYSSRPVAPYFSSWFIQLPFKFVKLDMVVI